MNNNSKQAKAVPPAFWHTVHANEDEIYSHHLFIYTKSWTLYSHLNRIWHWNVRKNESSNFPGESSGIEKVPEAMRLQKPCCPHSLCTWSFLTHTPLLDKNCSVPNKRKVGVKLILDGIGLQLYKYKNQYLSSNGFQHCPLMPILIIVSLISKLRNKESELSP